MHDNTTNFMQKLYGEQEEENLQKNKKPKHDRKIVNEEHKKKL